MRPKIDYRLYLVTDRTLIRTPSLEQAVEEAILGGCTVVQLREKQASSRDFYDRACRVKAITERHGIPLIINDRLDVALAVGATGVHIGQSDLPYPAVRAIAGPDLVVGVSVSTFEEARRAVDEGADYLGVGAMRATGTKSDAQITPMDDLLRIRESFSLPLVVIGGITLKNAPLFRRLGADGVAVVSAILAQDDIRKAAQDLRNAVSS